MNTGDRIDGLEIGRRLSSDGLGQVFEAVQPGLERSVVVRVLDGGKDPEVEAKLGTALARYSELSHPSLPDLLSAGSDSAGPFAVFGPRGGAGLTKLNSRRGAAAIAGVEEAVALLHANALAHGAIEQDAVRLSNAGTPTLLHAGTATAVLEAEEAASRDTDALHVLRDELAASQRRNRVLAAAAVVVALAAAVVVIGVASRDDPPPPPATVPPVAEGLVALGSELTGSRISTVGCDGVPPTPDSVDCTIMQTRVGGSSQRVPTDGVIRSWAVAGASGGVALNVLRPTGRGLRAVFLSQFGVLDGAGPHEFETDLPVRRGDRIALEVTLGSGVGIIPAEDAEVDLWSTGLEWNPRPADRQPPAALEGELALRVSIEPGAKRLVPAQISGDEAAEAADGTTLAELPFLLPEAGTRNARLVDLGDSIALDLFRGSRRLARIAIPDIDPEGSLDFFDFHDLRTPDGAIFSWTNPDGSGIRHDYLIGADSIRYVD